MIASRLAAWIAVGVALVLAVVLVIDLRSDTAPPSRALIPGFAAERVTRLTWQRPGEADVAIARTAETWRWAQPVPGVAAEPTTIDAVIAALRGGRWHRRAAATRAGAPGVTLIVEAGGRTMTIGIGGALEGAGQTWLAIGGHAYLVDDWIARALAPAPLALRDTRPLAGAGTADTIVIERTTPALALRLEGFPRRLVRPVALVVARERVAALHRALAALTIVGSTPASPATPRIVISLATAGAALVTVELADGGCAPGQAAIRGTAGDGCVATADLAALDAALDALARSATEIVETHLVPFASEPATITLPDGVVLDLTGRPRVGDHDADSGRVAELLAVLATPLANVLAVDPAVLGTASLTATDRGGAVIVIELLSNKLVRRRGEPVAFMTGEGALAILARRAPALRDPTLWSEDETTIHAIRIDAITYTRGAVLGEWRSSGPGSVDAALVTGLAHTLANVAARDTTAGVAPRHQLELVVVPPGGAARSRLLAIGPRTAAGCAATVDGRDVLLDTAICDAVAKLAR